MYKNNEWCGMIKDRNGPWSECLRLIDPNVLEGIYDGCLFDMCATEQKPELQSDYRCKAYEEIADTCNSILNSNQISNWRFTTRCRMF